MTMDAAGADLSDLVVEIRREFPGPAAPPGARGGGRNARTPIGAKAPRDWIPSFDEFCREVSDGEFGRIAQRAAREMRRSLKAVPKNKTPVFIVLFGPPGAGKTTIVEGVAESAGLRVGRQYVILDYDALDRYYPSYGDLMNVPGFVHRKKLGIGFAHAHMCSALNDFAIRLGDALLEDFVSRRLNIAVVSHRPSFLIQARLSGYRSVFVFVGAPLRTVVHRARQRAIDTGFLLAPTLEAQDSYVQSLWEEYIRLAPWYALWSDLFVAVDNGPELPEKKRGAAVPKDRPRETATRSMSVFDMRGEGGGLEARLTELYRRVAVAANLPAGKIPLPTLPAVGSFLRSAAGISPQGPKRAVTSREGIRTPKYRHGGARSTGQVPCVSVEEAIGGIDDRSGTWAIVRIEGDPLTFAGTQDPSDARQTVAVVIFRGDDSDSCPPTGKEIAAGLAIPASVYTIHGDGRWVVSPGDWQHTPCLSSPDCTWLLTELPWVERLVAWDQLEKAGGARVRETFPAKAAELGIAATWVAAR